MTALGGEVALLSVFLFLCLGATARARAFVPDFRVRPDDCTVLMAHDARLPEGMRPFQPGGHGKFHVTGWTRPDQVLSWEVSVPRTDAYAVNVLACRLEGPEIELSVSCGGRSVGGALGAAPREWTRETLAGTLRLPAGKQVVTLAGKARGGSGTFAVSILSVELVRPAVRGRLSRAAAGLRSDTKWLVDAGYGIMCHWTSETRPRRGEPRPYAEAVRDFDVEALAEQVGRTGAGFLVLTTSHARMQFPAPIGAVDGLLPGRTSERDLVADLAGALRRRNVRLMLYYHIGAASDPEWLEASGFWETDTTRIFDNWTAIVEEVGRRYGDRLAGWWFDDGSVNYYYRSAPWERLTRAAKAGHPGRLVGYNPWELPSPTEFQDFCCGEGFADPGAGGRLPVGGDGRFRTGTHAGLQACATLIAEADWVHSRADSDIDPPRWGADEMAAYLRDFISRGNVPIFNLEIYRDGTVSPRTVLMFERARAILGDVLPGRRARPE